MPKTGGTWLRAMLIAANLNILIILIYKKYNYDLFLPLKHYGIMTFIFISIFFKRPLEALKLPAGEFEEYFTSGAYKNNLPNIRFLQIENLRQGLYDFLCGNGYEQKYIQHVKNAQPKSPTGSYIQTKESSFHNVPAI